MRARAFALANDQTGGRALRRRPYFGKAPAFVDASKRRLCTSSLSRRLRPRSLGGDGAPALQFGRSQAWWRAAFSGVDAIARRCDDRRTRIPQCQIPTLPPHPKGHRLWFPISFAILAAIGIVLIHRQPELERNHQAWMTASLVLLCFLFVQSEAGPVILASARPEGFQQFGQIQPKNVNGGPERRGWGSNTTLCEPEPCHPKDSLRSNGNSLHVSCFRLRR